jgi:hypothetical protein
MDNVTNLLSALGEDLSVPVLLAAALGLLVGLIRLVLTARYWVGRGTRPLVIQVVYGTAAKDGEDYGVLDARLLSYISSDGLGGFLVAPGAGNPAVPAVPAESLEPTAALVRLALPAQPAYRVDVTWPGRTVPEGKLRATVRISKTPGDRIVASRSFAIESAGKDATQELVELIGSFCVIFLISQPRIARSVPRWERWDHDYTGYLHYRRGLRIERRGREPTTSLEVYREALVEYDKAARISPANMVVQLHRGALLELTRDDRSAAVALYRKCAALWPEHVEVVYRLSVSYKEVTKGATKEDTIAPMRQILAQLAYRRVLRAWLRTWRPGRWNPGERRYWRSWISLRPWRRDSKRAAFLRAVLIAQFVAELSFLIPERNGGGPRQPAAADGKAEVTRLMTALAALLVRPSRRLSPVEQILRPGGADAPLPAVADRDRIPLYGGLDYRRRATGWLSTFNAACFFSLAILLPDEYIPVGFDPGDWRQCCAQASVHELGLVHRDPRNALDPNWLARDRDLAPLRDTDLGKNWMEFIGLKPAKAEGAAPPSHPAP